MLHLVFPPAAMSKMRAPPESNKGDKKRVRRPSGSVKDRASSQG